MVDHDDSVLLAIAPTDSLLDLWRSLKISKILWPLEDRGTCHRGYLEAARIVAEHPRVYKQLEDKEIHLTGHSFGGSIAEAVAIWLHDTGRKVISSITFGAPAWMSKRFRWPQEISRSRFVCGRDPIPRLWAPRFCHLVQPTRLPSQSPPILPFLDHRLKSYMEALNDGTR